MSALTTAGPFLGLISLGVAALAVFGRDPQAGEHSVADYRPAPNRPREVGRRRLHMSRRDWPLVDMDTTPATRRPPVAVPPPASPEQARPLLFAELVVAQVAARYGDSPEDRAARMLREIAAEQRARTVPSC